MKNTIINLPYECVKIPESIMEMLPYRLAYAVRNQLEIHKEICEELRIRCSRMSTIIFSGDKNIPLDVSLSKEEMEEVFSKICGDSLYAHIETIKKGFVSLPNGVRAGISGKATVESGKIIGVSDINGICIRFPHFVKVDVQEIMNLLQSNNYSDGILFYSPAGVGKTTVLRSLAMEISKISKGLRTVIVDTRGELQYSLRQRGLCCDVLSGYPKALGIEIALRTMNARIIICDEIGSEDDVNAISNVANCGSILIASAHAKDIDGLMERGSIRELHKRNIFGYYVGISRIEDNCNFEITPKEDVK